MSTQPIEMILQESESELQRVVRNVVQPADDDQLSRLLATFDTLRCARETLAVRESLRALRAA
jgi:hypothetical protein